MKYSKIGGMLAWSGGNTLLRVGMSVDDDHPMVKERPELFNDKDPGADLKTSQSVSPHPTVERATAAPGEVRQTPGTGPRANRVPKVEGQ